MALVLADGPADLKPRGPIGDSHELAVFAPEGGSEVQQFVIPDGRRGFGFDGRDATGKTAVLGTLRQAVNSHRLTGVYRSREGKAPGVRRELFRRITHQPALALLFAP